MRTFGLSSAGLAAIFALFLPATPAQALAARTFVSGAGVDASASACNRTDPCLTFGFAQTKTDAGGEINCLDGGNFGAVTIFKSITIDCAGTPGGINPVNAATTDAVTINGAGIVVRIRNLTLNGMVVGTVGIKFTNGAALFVENCVIANFNGGAAGNGIGIKFTPPAGVTSELYVLDSVISTNGRLADGGGIVIQPAGSGSARVTIERTRVENNTFGIFANGTGSTGVIIVHIRDSVSAENTFDGISAFTAAGASLTSLTVDRSSSILNGGNGILAQGSVAFVLLAESTVISNVTGLSATSGGNIFSYQDNQLVPNVTDGAPTAVVSVK